MTKALIERVRSIYDRIEKQQSANANRAGACHACGRCCNFEEFDHRLYVTPAETKYLASHIGSEKSKKVCNGVCPYNREGKCAVYEYRFAACRIFCCNGDRDFQNQLSESVLRDLKKLCTDFNLAYQYKELTEALKSSEL